MQPNRSLPKTEAKLERAIVMNGELAEYYRGKKPKLSAFHSQRVKACEFALDEMEMGRVG